MSEFDAGIVQDGDWELPQRPKIDGDSCGTWWYICPMCHDPLDYKQQECGLCYQKIDWSKDDGKNEPT